MAYTDDLTGGKTYFCKDLMAGYLMENAFDNDVNTFWRASSSVPGWIGVDFADPMIITKIRVAGVSTRIKDFTFQGSNDFSTWDNLYSGQQTNDNTWIDHIIPNETAYRYYRVYITTVWSSGYGVGLSEIEMMATLVVDEYNLSGTYTTTTPADTLPTNPHLKWTEDLPTDTNITAEYAVNQDALTAPTTWTPINNNDRLTIPAPATGYFLWLKFTLATTDTAVTPTLLSVWLEEAEAPPDTILLSFDTYNRFNDVEGDITVAYNQSLGTLAGTRPVESFSVDFTPADLEPTPIDEHTITAGIDLTVDLIDLEFTEIYADHNVTHTATAGIDVTVALINIEDINP